MIFNVDAAKTRARLAANYTGDYRDLYVEQNMYSTFGPEYVKDEYLEVIRNGNVKT